MAARQTVHGGEQRAKKNVVACVCLRGGLDSISASPSSESACPATLQQDVSEMIDLLTFALSSPIAAGDTLVALFCLEESGKLVRLLTWRLCVHAWQADAFTGSMNTRSMHIHESAFPRLLSTHAQGDRKGLRGGKRLQLSVKLRAQPSSDWERHFGRWRRQLRPSR